jgi:hypothetical protein
MNQQETAISWNCTHWDITQRVVVNYYLLHNNPKAHSSHLLCGRRLKSGNQYLPGKKKKKVALYNEKVQNYNLFNVCVSVGGGCVSHINAFKRMLYTS